MPKEPIFNGTTLDEFSPEHYQAIGEFVVQYSMLESVFHSVFECQSGLPKDMSRSVVGGMRLKDVIDRTKRVMRAKNAPESQFNLFEAIEATLNPISAFRDKVIHRVWLNSEFGPVLMNICGAKSSAGLVKEVVTTEELKQQTFQSLKLCLFVSILALDDNALDKMWNNASDQEKAGALEALRKISPELNQLKLLIRQFVQALPPLPESLQE